MSKQNHSWEVTQVSVQKTHDFGTLATAWHMFWGGASVDTECHRPAEVTGAVTTETRGGSALFVHNSCKTHTAPHPEPLAVWPSWCEELHTHRAAHARRGQGERLDLHPDLGFMPALAAMTWTKPLNTTCAGVSKHWESHNIFPGCVGKVDTRPCPQEFNVTSPGLLPSCTSVIQWNNNISPGLTPWPVWIICFRKTWNHLLYPT